MTGPRDPLFARIDEFAIDEGTPALTFADRLAHENGWTRAFTERVIREYKRFVYLTQVADHLVVPSEEVDQAWHLHLTYTRSYWDRLCGEVLGRPLHHNPTRGGADESAKFGALYRRTLTTYRDVFGEHAPADIWPNVAARFDGDWRRVDARRHWIVRRPRLRLGRTAAALGLMPLGAALTPDVYPFTLVGMQFFTFYLPAYAATFLLALLLRRRLLRPDADPDAPAPRLEPAAAAYLAGGEAAMVNTALASLVARGALSVDVNATFRTAGELPDGASLAERRVYQSVQRRDGATVPQVRQGASAAGADVRQRLTELGLLVDPADYGRVRGLPLLLGLAVPAVGFWRLANGVVAGRPVGFLIAALAVTTVLSLVVFLWRPFRSRRGSAVLRQLRAEHARLRQVGAAGGAAPELALGVALFGAGALAGSEYDHLRKTLAPPVNAGGDGSSGSGCSSGCSGGGGGCGGGGCGGGGCGG